MSRRTAIEAPATPDRSRGRWPSLPQASPAQTPAKRTLKRGSMIVTSNKSFAEWGQVLGDDVLATAILDRLLHHCDVLAINGPSYRLKDRLALVPGGDPMP